MEKQHCARIYRSALMVLVLATWACARDVADPAQPPAALTIADLEVGKAPADYLEACELFLKARVSDRAKDRYDDAIASLREASRTDAPSEIRLRCLFLIAFAHLLEGRNEEARTAAAEAIDVIRGMRDYQQVAEKIGRIKTSLREGRFKDIAAVVGWLEIGKDTAELVADFARLYQGRERYRQKLDRRWQRHQTAMNAVIGQWAEQEGLSVVQTDELRSKLEGKYRPRGFVAMSEVEDELVRYSLEELTK